MHLSSNYCPHLNCDIHNVSASVPFGFFLAVNMKTIVQDMEITTTPYFRNL